MNKLLKDSDGQVVPPLRTLDDFLLASARFQIPNVKDFDKWGKRVVGNLLYYQTNYFFMAVVIFLGVGFFHSGKMLVGCTAAIVALSVFTFFSAEGRAIHNFRKKYPIAGVAVVLLGGCFIVYTLSSMLIFLIGIILPVSAIFVHASLRLRNIQNKLVNKIEGIGLMRTPMGVLLNNFGMEPELFD